MIRRAIEYVIENTCIGIRFIWVICPYCGASIRLEKMTREQGHLCPDCYRVFIECLAKDRKLRFEPS